MTCKRIFLLYLHVFINWYWKHMIIASAALQSFSNYIILCKAQLFVANPSRQVHTVWRSPCKLWWLIGNWHVNLYQESHVGHPLVTDTHYQADMSSVSQKNINAVESWNRQKSKKSSVVGHWNRNVAKFVVTGCMWGGRAGTCFNLKTVWDGREIILSLK